MYTRDHSYRFHRFLFLFLFFFLLLFVLLLLLLLLFNTDKLQPSYPADGTSRELSHNF